MTTLAKFLATTIALSIVGGFAVTAASAAVVPPKRQPVTVTTYKCGSELGYLKRVYEDEVASLERVSIVPMCDGEDYGLMRSEGNVGALRLAMADNSAVMEALDGANFRVDDVIGIRITGDEKAIIYVHTFHR
jgi:hypothetical protein